MELNDESENGAPGAGDKARKRAGPAEETEKEAEIEAAVEAEIEADAASYKSELVGENEFAGVEIKEEAAASEDSAPREYPRAYEPPLAPIAKRESLLKRLKPYYLTAAGLLLITRIVVYSLRRRRR